MIDPTSRYYLLETAQYIDARGREIAYKRRRFLPQGSAMPLLTETPVEQDERIDQLTARTLGDPTHFWRVCDANDAMHPLEFMAEAGRLVRIPVPQA